MASRKRKPGKEKGEDESAKKVKEEEKKKQCCVLETCKDDADYTCIVCKQGVCLFHCEYEGDRHELLCDFECGYCKICYITHQAKKKEEEDAAAKKVKEEEEKKKQCCVLKTCEGEADHTCILCKQEVCLTHCEYVGDKDDPMRSPACIWCQTCCIERQGEKKQEAKAEKKEEPVDSWIVLDVAEDASLSTSYLLPEAEITPVIQNVLKDFGGASTEDTDALEALLLKYADRSTGIGKRLVIDKTKYNVVGWYTFGSWA